MKVACPYCGTMKPANERFCFFCSKDCDNAKKCPTCGQPADLTKAIVDYVREERER